MEQAKHLELYYNDNDKTNMKKYDLTLYINTNKIDSSIEKILSKINIISLTCDNFFDNPYVLELINKTKYVTLMTSKFVTNKKVTLIRCHGYSLNTAKIINIYIYNKESFNNFMKYDLPNTNSLIITIGSVQMNDVDIIVNKISTKHYKSIKVNFLLSIEHAKLLDCDRIIAQSTEWENIILLDKFKEIDTLSCVDYSNTFESVYKLIKITPSNDILDNITKRNTEISNNIRFYRTKAIVH